MRQVGIRPVVYTKQNKKSNDATKYGRDHGSAKKASSKKIILASNNPRHPDRILQETRDILAALGLTSSACLIQRTSHQRVSVQYRSPSRQSRRHARRGGSSVLLLSARWAPSYQRVRYDSRTPTRPTRNSRSWESTYSHRRTRYRRTSCECPEGIGHSIVAGDSPSVIIPDRRTQQPTKYTPTQAKSVADQINEEVELSSRALTTPGQTGRARS